MPRIAHLADIHVRGLSRHEEYIKAFTRCFEQIREDKPDIIFVGGDIVHSKTQGISPELIDLLVWWFSSLAEIAPTHVILGNHDGILTNRDRQDAITPIITALNSDRIFLYKKSGTYPTGIPGFNWCVFSCFDEEGWSSVKPLPGDINIATFHGAVRGSMTDIDWEIEGEVDAGFFENFDFALLGDIHRQQFLTHDRRVAYSGSTIQQDYGEDRRKGYLLWDIRSRNDFDVTFREVPGVNPFVTIEWQGTVRQTLDSSRDQIPQNARVRVKSKDPIQSVEWNHLCSELGEFYKTAEVVSQNNRDFDIQRIAAQEVEMSKEDLRDPETQMKLLRNFFRDTEIADDEWVQMEELVKKYLRVLSQSDDFVRRSHWSLRKLEFENTFSYGGGNVINFDHLPGITGIFGRNAQGKSSIVGTIMYALFNATDRGPMKNLHVINTRKDYCLTKATVGVDGDLYRFERQTVKHQEKDGSDGALTYLNVLKVDEDGSLLEDHSREQRRVSENVIRSKLGYAEDFLMTSLAAQGEMNTFISKKNTARKAILTRVLGLDIFDQLADLIRDESKIIQGQLKTFPDRDWDRMIDERLIEKDTCESRLVQIEREMENDRVEETTLKEMLAGVNVDLVTPADVEKQELIISNLVEKLYQKLKVIDDLETAIVGLAEKCEKITRIKETVSIDELRARLNSQRDLEKNLLDMRHRVEREATLLKQQERAVEKLREVPCGDAFPMCKFIKESHESKQKIEGQRNRLAELEGTLEEAERNFKDLAAENVEEKIAKFESILRSEIELKSSIAVKKSQEERLHAEVEDGNVQLVRERSALSNLRAKVVTEDLDADVTKKKDRLNTIGRNLKYLDGERLTLASKMGSIDTTIVNLRAEKEKYFEIKKVWRAYELLLQGLSKRGIPLQVIMSQLPIINAEIAKILQGVVSFTVELEADINSNEMDVFINYGDSRRIIEVASGMEKLIASLAIRVALINVSSLPKTDMLIIDEGFGTLDDMNIEACNRLLFALKKWFRNILIITHIDGIKDVVDNVIDITWHGKDANVSYE